MLKIYRDNNPILAPMQELPWTHQSVFNPGVVYDNGKFRMIFSGNDGKGCIQLGYAESTDGINFNVRETPFLPPDPDENAFDHGTTEDPRVTLLDGKFYITYAARCLNMSDWANGKRKYDPKGEHAIAWERNNRRVGLAVTTDWQNVERLGAISSEHMNDANVVLFPEKINGKYVYLHRPSSAPAWLLPMMYEPGRAWILFTDTINKWCSDKIAEAWNMEDKIDLPDDYMLLAPEQKWESMKVGPSGVPIPTDDGWLMTYHGVDRKGIYRVGLALLDREDPRKVLCRTPEPIMEPEGKLELQGGPYPGCIFPCANVVTDDEIRLFYGICDISIGTATMSLADALDHVKKFKV